MSFFISGPPIVSFLISCAMFLSHNLFFLWFPQHEQCASEREDLMARLDTLQTNVGQMEAHAFEMSKDGCA